MIAYLDSSVILRVILREPGELPEWDEVKVGITSAITEVECLRTLDRFRLRHAASFEEATRRRASLFELLESIDVLEIERPILSRASEPFPTPLGTVDALHLASALTWRDQNRVQLTLATHDTALALAARASGLKTIGSS